MKKNLIFVTIFLYADVSNIILKIDKIERYKPVFKYIYMPECKEKKVKIISVNNKIPLSKKRVELKLLAIFNKKALINNEWLKKGDIIKGYKVIEIYPKKVVLKRENHFIILKFNDLLKVKK
jgi:hypothetical protein